MKPQRSVPKFTKASDEMKVWSSALAAEVADWPKVEIRSFFGFTALYRGERIFAALPRTKAMWTPNAIGFKIKAPSAGVSKRLDGDTRIQATRMQKARWFLFDLSDAYDLHGALDWLGEAYEAAGKTGIRTEKLKAKPRAKRQ